jgi:hypothetical protein
MGGNMSLDTSSVDYEKLFLEFVETLTDADLVRLSRSMADIYWDFYGKEFFLYAHSFRPNGRCFKVFDTTADDDFPALETLKYHAGCMNDLFIFQQETIDAIDALEEDEECAD